MRERDWPALIAPVSGATLAIPSLAHRLRDLVTTHGVHDSQLWLEVMSSADVLDAPRLVSMLARRHSVGCSVHIDEGFEERALLPELAALGISFIVLHPGKDRCVASDLSAMIIGRSLSRRARANGITALGPTDLDADILLLPEP